MSAPVTVSVIGRKMATLEHLLYSVVYNGEYCIVLPCGW